MLSNIGSAVGQLMQKMASGASPILNKAGPAIIKTLPGRLFRNQKGTGAAVKQFFSYTSQRGAIVTSVVPTVWGWTSWIFALVIGFLFWIIKTVFSRLIPSVLKSLVDDWEENRVADYEERRDRVVASIRRNVPGKYTQQIVLVLGGFVEFIVQFVVVVVYAFIPKWLKFIVDHFVILFITFLIAGAFFFLRTHLPGATSLYQETAVAGVETVNVASSVGNAAIAGAQITMPFNNFMISSTIEILIQIDEGARMALGIKDPEETPISRRSLQGYVDDRSETEKFLETIVNVLIIVGYFFLQLLLISIKIFFLVIWPVLPAILKILEFLLYRLGCIFAGQFCGLLEILDAIVNLILGPFTLIFGKIDIACGANELRGVRCDCAGWLWSFETPGIYRKIEPCGVADPRYSIPSEYEDESPARRMLMGASSSYSRNMMVRCSKTEDGDFVEEVGKHTSISKTSDIFQACSVARRAFHPYTHAQDMERFGTHDCITHCVLDVAMISCDRSGNHTVSILGSCSDSAMDEGEAKRQLAFLKVDLSMLSPPPVPNRRHIMEDQQLSHSSIIDRIARLKSQIPVRFTVDGIGECDVSIANAGFYEMYDALRCALAREFKSNVDWTPWKNGGGSASSRLLYDAIDGATHSVRQARHAHSVDDVTMLYDGTRPVSPVHYVQWTHAHGMKERGRMKRSPPRRNLQGLELPDEEETSFAPSTSPTAFDDPNTEPVNPEDPIPCFGRIMCPDQVTCVVDSKYCTLPTEWSPIIAYSYYMQQISSGLNSFDVYKEIARVKKCYQNRPFSRSPYNPRYVFMSYADKLKDKTVLFCPGEFAPTDLKFGTLAYKPNEDIATFCTGSANFDGCRCPDFWDTRGNSVQYSGVSSDWIYVFLNGMKWFLYVIWLMLNAIAGWIDSLLESAGLPNFTQASNSGYGLTNSEFSKCVFLHTGDAAATVLFLVLLWGLLLSAEYVAEWVINWFNAAAVVACVPDPNSLAYRLAVRRNRAYDDMKAEWQGKLDTIMKSRLNTPNNPYAKIPVVKIEFTRAQYKAALRFKKFLIRDKDTRLAASSIEMPRRGALKDVNSVVINLNNFSDDS